MLSGKSNKVMVEGYTYYTLGIYLSLQQRLLLCPFYLGILLIGFHLEITFVTQLKGVLVALSLFEIYSVSKRLLHLLWTFQSTKPFTCKLKDDL